MVYQSSEQISTAAVGDGNHCLVYGSDSCFTNISHRMSGRANGEMRRLLRHNSPSLNQSVRLSAIILAATLLAGNFNSTADGQERRPGRTTIGRAGQARVSTEQEAEPEISDSPELMRIREAVKSIYTPEGLTPDEVVNVFVYEQVNRSVVNITTKMKTDTFFGAESEEGAGSGSVLDKRGHVLTNYHVIQDAQEVTATLFDGKSYEATYVGGDPINDIAIIKINAPPEILFPVKLGESGQLKVGMRVFAIGNPFGLERTLTTGVISSLNRSLSIHGNRTIKSIIQIDASINPGNSGGPLVDSHARLIGMNTAIASRTGQSAGVGFAIPVNLISRIITELIQHGKVIRPEIGISRVYQTEEGLLVAALAPGGPAEQAGLRGPQVRKIRRGPLTMQRTDRNTADLIIALNGKAVKTADDFLSLIEDYKPGETVLLTILREGKEAQVPVKLGGEEATELPRPERPR